MNNWQPFPVEALPEPLRGYVRTAAQAIGCDESYIALPILSACGSLIGNSRRLMVQHGWFVPPIIWAVIVGESGTAKSPAIASATKPIQTMQRRTFDRHKAEMMEYEQSSAKWKADKSQPVPTMPVCQQLMASDTTVEALAMLLLDAPRGLLLCRDELSGWFGSFDRYAGKGKASGDAAHWLSMYGAMPLLVNRKGSMPGQPRRIYVPSAAVSICGGIQPGILARALSPEHRESGLAARFLFAYPPRKPKKWTGKGIDEATEQELSALYESLREQLQPETDKEGHLRPKLVRFGKNAMALWVKWYNEHNQEQVNLSGDEAAAWSKLEETPARLALILHYVKWSAGEVKDSQADKVEVETLEQAIELTRWFAHESRRVYGMLAQAPEDAERKRLIDWIRSKGGKVTVRDLQRSMRRYTKKDEAELALHGLIDDGLGRWQLVEAGAEGGRPKTMFILADSADCRHNPEKPCISRGSVSVGSVSDPENDDDGPGWAYYERLAEEALGDDSEGGHEE